MKQLNNQELNAINGGGLKLWAAVTGGIAVFIIGVVDGYVRPSKCK